MELKKMNILNTYSDDKSFQKDLKRVSQLLENPIAYLSLNEKSDMAFYLERMFLSTILSMQDSKDDGSMEMFFKLKPALSNKERDAFIEEHIPVTIEKKTVEGISILHIHTPFVFRKSTKKSFYIADLVNIKMRMIEEKDSHFFDDFREKCNLSVVRVAEKFNPSSHCDNDNIETSEIINFMFFNIGISDNPKMMSFYNDFVFPENNYIQGTHFFIASYKHSVFPSEKLLDFFAKNN